MASFDMLTPESPDELIDAITAATRAGTKISLRGGGSKDGFGASTPDAQIIDMRGFAGVVEYDPSELVLTVGAGTPLWVVRDLVAEEGQMLAFDPFEHGPILGRPDARATIGGVIAAGVSGSLRLTQGAARDHLLGLEAISGRGERFVAGGKVVKNVTGYDLPKLMTGSWGRLAAITQVTLKVLPRPRTRATKIIIGLDCVTAVGAMSKALASQAEVSAAAYLPSSKLVNGASLTALRVQGFAASVKARCAMLDRLFADHSPLTRLDDDKCANFWNEIATLSSLDAGRTLWRLHVPPSRAADLIDRFELASSDWFLDWAGGLIWMLFDGPADRLRNAAASVGGHATLVRAPQAMRHAVPAFHPPTPGVAALEARVRRAFDPASVFETGRF